MCRGTVYFCPRGTVFDIRDNLGGYLGDKITKKSAIIKHTRKKSAKSYANFNA